MTEPTEKQDSGLWAIRDDIKGGKYLVLRRDGTVFDEPNFVLGPRDPATPETLHAYARICVDLYEHRQDGPQIYNRDYIRDIRRLAVHIEEMQNRAADEGKRPGDPGKGPHRKDHQLIVAAMVSENPKLIVELFDKMREALELTGEFLEERFTQPTSPYDPAGWRAFNLVESAIDEIKAAGLGES